MPAHLVTNLDHATLVTFYLHQVKFDVPVKLTEERDTIADQNRRDRIADMSLLAYQLHSIYRAFFLTFPGATSKTRLNARLNAASLWYPSFSAIAIIGSEPVLSCNRAICIRQRVR